MADRPVDLTKAVGPFRQLQAYAGQSLSSLFAEFERLEGLVTALANYSLPAELVAFTQFNNLSEVIEEVPAGEHSRPGGNDASPGARLRPEPGARERKRAAARPGSRAGQRPGAPSPPGKQRPAPVKHPVLPVGDPGRRPGAVDLFRSDRRATQAGTPAGAERDPAQDLPISPGEGRRPEERQPTAAGDRREGGEGRERPPLPVAGARPRPRPGDAEAPTTPHPDARAWSGRPAAGQAGTGNNGWRLLETLSLNLLQEGADGDGRERMAGGRPRSGAPLQPPLERKIRREDRPFAAPVGLGRGPGDPDEAGLVVEEFDPRPALPPEGPQTRPDLGGHGPVDLDRLAEWLNELLRDQARRHGVQIE